MTVHAARLRPLVTIWLTVLVAPAAALAAGPGAGVASSHRGGITLFRSIGRVSLGTTPAQGQTGPRPSVGGRPVPRQDQALLVLRR
jgi:hypothetical protein